jgi:hypothetical protein
MVLILCYLGEALTQYTDSNDESWGEQQATLLVEQSLNVPFYVNGT